MLTDDSRWACSAYPWLGYQERTAPRGRRKDSRPAVMLTMTNSVCETNNKTHGDPTKVIEIRSTIAGGIRVRPLNHPLRGAGDERRWLLDHGKEVVVLEVCTNLTLNLVVAKTGDGTNKHSVQALIFVSEISAKRSLSDGVSISHTEGRGRAIHTLLNSSAETASISQF